MNLANRPGSVLCAFGSEPACGSFRIDRRIAVSRHAWRTCGQCARAIRQRSGQPFVSPGSLVQRTIASAGNPGDIRIALNLPGLLKTPYFRSYWVQRNASQLKPFAAGVVDLFREPQQIREERTFLRESASPAPTEGAVAQVVAWAPPDSGLYRAWADPQTSQVLDLIRTKIVAPGTPGNAPSRIAPAAGNPDSIAGDSSDLETRIDQAPLHTQVVDATSSLRPVIEATGVRAMLHVQSSRPSTDGVFVDSDSAIALLSNTDWPQVNLPEISVHRQGPIMVIATSSAMLQKVVGRLNAPAASNLRAAYTAHYSHSRELAAYTRMMAKSTPEMLRRRRWPAIFLPNIASLPVR